MELLDLFNIMTLNTICNRFDTLFPDFIIETESLIDD